jgi:hypothetical protein
MLVTVNETHLMFKFITARQRELHFTQLIEAEYFCPPRTIQIAHYNPNEGVCPQAADRTTKQD